MTYEEALHKKSERLCAWVDEYRATGSVLIEFKASGREGSF
ncbi:MAG: hypothetical protein QOH42_1507 [Blastocatellia bacterium]|jgi:hypothetical protein|nr:hypothetical protein [Blastocatellia bacterium]